MANVIARRSGKRTTKAKQPPKRSSSRTKARPSTIKSARLEARVNPELRKLIEHAAQLEGRKLSEFVTEALLRAARHAIAEANVLRLSLADQERFAQALLTPPAAAPALKRAFARRRDLVV